LGPATVALVCAIVKEPVRLAATVALIGAAVNAVTTIVYAVTLQFLEGSFTTVGYYSDPTMPTAPLVDVTAVGNVFTGELAPLMWIGVILVGAVVPSSRPCWRSAPVPPRPPTAPPWPPGPSCGWPWP
ncbi:MAG: hypothetical protein ACLUE1_08830, partial [Adlercreutzia equolifaciens]